MEKANMSHYKYIQRAIKYIPDTKYYFFQMKSEGNINLPWEICGYSDVDYVGDDNTWNSVTG